MMINQIITDASDSGSYKRHKVVVRTRRCRAKQTQKQENVEITEENQQKNVERNIIPRLTTQGKSVVRFVDQIERKTLKYRKLSSYLTCKIKRERANKINGRRTYFKYSEENRETRFIAKAKFETSEEIPINKGDTIHLSSPNFYAKLLIKNHRSLFSLHVGDNETPIEDIQFMLSRAATEGPRRMSVFIYPDDAKGTNELTLESKHAADMPDFGKLYRVVSIKNAILGPVGEEENLISIRKTSEDTLEIDTKLDIESIQLFALGIASFLGRIPQ
jgi:hypothetical protein